MSAADRWRDDLAAWQVPRHILDGADESPWVLPRQVFVRRADRQLARPAGPSHLAAWHALQPPGRVLDVGAGAGAASLPLAPRCTEIIAVDRDAQLLDEFARRAGAAGAPHLTAVGSWPDVAGDVPPADVVVCHHVIYNVPELGAFATALTGHARRLVVVETARRHPLTALNELWRRFHGTERPDGPTADDAVAVLAEVGIEPTVQHWRRPPTAEHSDFAALVDVTRRRLCLPRARAGEVATALLDAGHGRGELPDLGSSGDDVVTLTWPGGATIPPRVRSST